MMDAEIEAIETLGAKIRAGWRGDSMIKTSERAGLVQCAYTPARQWTPTPWTQEEIVSRGIVFDALTGACVARPFSKFFNWGEGGRTTEAPMTGCYIKHDGTLIIGWYWGGRVWLSTRGTLAPSEYTDTAWAALQFDLHMPSRSETHMFELVGLKRIVVKYDRVRAHRLARRDDPAAPLIRYIATTHASEAPFCSVGEVADYCKTAEGIEGFVCTFADGSTFKLKTEWYKRLHGLHDSLTPKRVGQAMLDGNADDMRALAYELGRGAEFDGLASSISERAESIERDVRGSFAEAPDGDRKAFAEWAKKQPGSSWLFMLRDGRDISADVLKCVVAGLAQIRTDFDGGRAS